MAGTWRLQRPRHEVAVVVSGCLGILGVVLPWSSGTERGMFGGESGFAYTGLSGAMGLIPLAALALAVGLALLAPRSRGRAVALTVLFLLAFLSALLAWANQGDPRWVLELSTTVQLEMGPGLPLLLASSGVGTLAALFGLFSGASLAARPPLAQGGWGGPRLFALGAALVVVLGALGPWYHVGWQAERGEYRSERTDGTEGLRGQAVLALGVALALGLAALPPRLGLPLAAVGFVGVLLILLLGGPYPLPGPPPEAPPSGFRSAGPSWGYDVAVLGAIAGALAALVALMPWRVRLPASAP